MSRSKTWMAALTSGALLLSVGLLALSSSCDADGYCVDCFDAGGNVDGDATVNPLIDASVIDSGDLPDACVLSGLEQCDGIDNDCDGETDEGDLTGVDVECGLDMGVCEFGITVCDEGEIVCQGGITPIFELCNLLDDDCDGDTDENNPEGGIICGTNQGECEAGVQLCENGALSCMGQVSGGTESCNGLDDDCDGSFDENISVSGNCGPTSDDGLCTFGTQTCIGGNIQCSGAVLPTPEVCDVMDRDCDGDPLNGFNLATDIQNCGSCGTTCMEDRAFMGCVASTCVIAACETGYFDLDTLVSTGCEFGPCSFQGSEICNGVDDDCDGSVDEGVNANPPAICDQDGECNGATATCTNGTFVCGYGATVSLDGNGDIVAEIDCDELDNDCDGRVDEAFVTKGNACDDGELGGCLDTGTIVCNGSDDGVVCTAVDDDGAPPAESCNNLDDDCDGTIDEGDPRDWVDLGGGVEMFKYEASRPDSTSTVQGFISDQAVCSDANRLPWTNITQPEAETACASIGARLCTETEWQDTCVPEAIGPGNQGTDGLLVFEAEEIPLLSATTGNWLISTNTPGFSGTFYAFIEDGTVTDTTNANALAGAPRLDYTINFTQTGTHYLWVRVQAGGGSTDSMWWAIDDNDGNISEDHIDLDNGQFGNWIWMGVSNDNSRMQFNIAGVGAHTLSFYNRNDGIFIDKVIISDDVNFTPTGHGQEEVCQWSYQSDCRDYQPDTCNGEDFDGDSGTAGDQDIMLASGTMNACFSQQTTEGVFDLSGNIKEWTAERSAGVNPIRGGSFNNTAIGTSCQFDFLTADDTFFLPNIGFRCCR